jgi:alpha-amylase
MNQNMNTTVERSICMYFQVHQPMRLKRYRFFDIGADSYYYDDYLNRSIIQRVASKSYIPANNAILDLINKFDGKFKVAYSLSGTVLDQLQAYAPEVIESFKQLAATGCVEFLAETDAHSLASLKNKEEFRRQVKQHSDKIEEIFGVKPLTFRNTELVYSDEIGEMVAEMGYKTMMIEGAKHVLGWKSPNYIYKNADVFDLKLLLRNYTLSDDIAFRFSNHDWAEWPLTSTKFADWIAKVDKKEPVVNLFMDYETFGEHQWEESGIFGFLKSFPEEVLKSGEFQFRTPQEVATLNEATDIISVPSPMSWADEERDLTAWLGNDLQDDAHSNLYKLTEKIHKINDPELLNDWMNLQNSDHFYYMCTKWFSDGAVHQYFNPYDSPYDAYINYMNVLSDFMIRIDKYIESAGIQVDIEQKEETKPVVKTIAKKNEVKKTTVRTKAKKSTKTVTSKKSTPSKQKTMKYEDFFTLSQTKIKSVLRQIDNNEIYMLHTHASVEQKTVLEKNLGKRVLSAIVKMREEKVKVLKKDSKTVQDKILSLIKA